MDIFKNRSQPRPTLTDNYSLLFDHDSVYDKNLFFAPKSRSLKARWHIREVLQTSELSLSPQSAKAISFVHKSLQVQQNHDAFDDIVKILRYYSIEY